MRIGKYFAVGLLAAAATAHAANIVFDSDPFAGTTALTDPGRQIVGGPGTEFAFDIATDVFVFDQGVFGINQILFANGLDTDLPASDVNTIVIQNTGTPFGAGTAANLIAGRVATAGPGFFVYFNTSPALNVARLVYSTDLSSQEADLAILGRLTTFSGPAGLAALPTITESNFATIPEPSSVLLTFGGALLGCLWARRRRSRTHS